MVYPQMLLRMRCEFLETFMFFAQTLGKHGHELLELHFRLQDVMAVELTRTWNTTERALSSVFPPRSLQFDLRLT